MKVFKREMCDLEGLIPRWKSLEGVDMVMERLGKEGTSEGLAEQRVHHRIWLRNDTN